MGLDYLNSAKKELKRYKDMAEKTIEQLTDKELKHEFGEDSNSISVIFKHIAGNMRSRFTNFLSEDGEKPWRHRDIEFVDTYKTRSEMLSEWEKSWACLFNTIEPLSNSDLDRTVYIRNEPHTVVEALNRQITHYAYHIGQIVILAKIHKGKEWQSLSIPLGRSEEFNKEKFKSNQNDASPL